MNVFNMRFRSTRRLAVIAHYASLGLGFSIIGFMQMMKSISQTLADPKYIMLHYYTRPVICSLVVAGVVYLLTAVGLCRIVAPYGVDGKRWTPGPNVDERQRRVRSDALGYSYWLLSSIVVADLTWSILFDNIPFTRLFVAEILMSSMFPTAIIAWSEPDMQSELSNDTEDVLHPVSRPI